MDGLGITSAITRIRGTPVSGRPLVVLHRDTGGNGWTDFHRALAQDLDLGTFAKSELPDAPRADAAFALKQGEVSQPVKGSAGSFMLLRVTKITPAVNQSLADVHDAIKKTLALQQATGKLADVVNNFEAALGQITGFHGAGTTR